MASMILPMKNNQKQKQKNPLAKYSIVELLREIKGRKNAIEELECAGIRLLTVAGFTTEDIVVKYYKDSYLEDEGYIFMFYFKPNDRKSLIDFYYGDIRQGDRFDFIPKIFAEESENNYSSKLNLQETIEHLKKCGYKQENIIETDEDGKPISK